MGGGALNCTQTPHLQAMTATTTLPPIDVSPALSGGSIQSTLAWLSDGSGRAAALTEHLLQRAEQTKTSGAYIHTARAQALAHANRCDASKAMPADLVLRGLPIVVKDNIDVAGMPTTSGSPAIHHLATRSASAIDRLEQAGAVVLGKTNLHEMCFGITSNNAAYGPVRNPYVPDHISGGSSGGTAAAIAAGLAPAGIGSDTGGSMRIPAALCGVVGLRPSTGRWPSDGVLKISHTRDTLGPMGRTVADCALLDAIVCGESAVLPAVSLQGLRLGVPQTLFWQGLDPEMERAGQAVLHQLKAAGVQLVPCDLGIDVAACDHAGMVVAVYESLVCLEAYLSSRQLPFDAAKIAAQVASPDVRGIFEDLLKPEVRDAADYARALQVQRPLLRQAYAQCFERHTIEALIFPTTPLAASPIGQDEEVMLCGKSVPAFPTFTRQLACGSFAGQPGISIPMGLNTQGLPLGIALDGPVLSDRRLLAIAQAIQTLIGFIPPPPARA